MNRITNLLGIQYPIIQGGMIWCSGWRLAAAVSQAGGLGLIGSGSMDPETLKLHIENCKTECDKPFGVNIPLIFKYSEEFVRMVIEMQVPVVFTSAGNPAKYTRLLKDHGIKVVHVVANIKSAIKSEDAGVDAVVCEGFEAGGHNGKEETTTMVLVPMIREKISIPLIAAGGIINGRSMAAAFALGAEGVQVGSRFVASIESSAHENFKKAILTSSDGETRLLMKKVIPVRLLKNKFSDEICELEASGASEEILLQLLGRGRAKTGMFDGDLIEGELEIGQGAAFINEIKSAKEIFEDFIKEYNLAIQGLEPLL